jgi:hypothetical protein
MRQATRTEDSLAGAARGALPDLIGRGGGSVGQHSETMNVRCTSFAGYGCVPTQLFCGAKAELTYRQVMRKASRHKYRQWSGVLYPAAWFLR